MLRTPELMAGAYWIEKIDQIQPVPGLYLPPQFLHVESSNFFFEVSHMFFRLRHNFFFSGEKSSLLLV